MLSSASSASEHREGRVCSHRRTLAFHNATPQAQRLPERVLDVTEEVTYSWRSFSTGARDRMDTATAQTAPAAPPQGTPSDPSAAPADIL